MKPLNQLAAEILVDWKDTPSTGSYRRFAIPYVEAMLSMRNCEDKYGFEYGDMIVARALNALHQWRGNKAREVKLALNKHLEVYNARHNGS
jgi:hypothetical protein